MNPVLAAMNITSVGLITQLAAKVGSVLSRELRRKQFFIEGRTSGLCLIIGQRVQQKRSSMVDIILKAQVSTIRPPTPPEATLARLAYSEIQVVLI